MCAFQRLINSSPPLAGHDHIRIVTGVSGPYRSAISAGSGPVPPLAARSDAVAGSTFWRHSRHPAKPCGSRRSREARRRRGSPKGRHHTINRTWAAAAFPQRHRGAGVSVAPIPHVYLGSTPSRFLMGITHSLVRRTNIRRDLSIFHQPLLR
jgi:hypothetical protein